MHTAVPPPDDVIRLMHAHGTRPAAPVGTDGSWWVARPAEGEDGPWLEVLVADVPVDGALGARAGALTGLDHPHLSRVLAVEPLGPGRVALVCEHVAGPTLAAVRAARPPLGDGEVVTVAVPVAQALAALHAAGLAHGAVGADRVVLRPGGVPVLVDPRGALRGAGTPTGDVHRLVATLLGLMPSLDAHLAAGMEEAVLLRDALEGLLRARAAPDDVVTAVFAAAQAEPLLVPEPDELAGAQVALEAGRTGLPRTTEPGAADPGPPRRARRARGRAGRGTVVVAAAAVGLVLVGGGVLGVRALTAPHGAGEAAAVGSSAPPEPPAPEQSTAPGSVAASPSPERSDESLTTERADPGAAAAALTRLRGAALAAADGAALDRLHVEGSPSRAADRALLEQLAGARSDGLATEVTATTPTGTTPEGDPTVAVTSTVSAHVRVLPSGERTAVPATSPRTVELVLRWTPDGWRAWDVREPRAATP